MNKIWNLSPYFKRPYNWLYWISWTFPLAWIDDLSTTESWWKVSLTWTDPDDVVKWWKTVASWTSTKLVRKEWSAPTDSTDWDLILTETTKNQYSSSWYTDSTIPVSWTYYYVAFAVADNWLETISNIEEVEVVVSLYKTYTIVRQEVADPSQAFLRYEDDAVWMTQWSADFDTFFWYSWVRLSSAWVETWTVDLTNMSSETWLDSWDNVMVKFPIRWIKMSKSWSQVSLSITDDPNAESKWFQYYAHSRWTFSNPIKKDCLYIWNYEWYAESSVLKSLSWKQVGVNQTMSTCIYYARNNDNNDWSKWYDVLWFYQRMYISALYMMKYGNLDSQTTIWKWIVSWSKQASWWSNSISWTTWWDSSWTTAVKLFWLENRRWNVSEFLTWICTDWSKYLYTALSWFVWNVKTDSPYESTWAIVSSVSGNYSLSSIVWDNKSLFAPTWTVWNNSYYSDMASVGASCLCRVWWYFADGNNAWIFDFVVLDWPTSKWTWYWPRLMYL